MNEEWSEFPKWKPYRKYRNYWVKTDKGIITIAEWDGEDWVALQPAYEYKREEYTIEDFACGKVIAFQQISKPG